MDADEFCCFWTDLISSVVTTMLDACAYIEGVVENAHTDCDFVQIASVSSGFDHFDPFVRWIANKSGFPHLETINWIQSPRIQKAIKGCYLEDCSIGGITKTRSANRVPSFRGRI
jgi:hypothetical protein